MHTTIASVSPEAPNLRSLAAGFSLEVSTYKGAAIDSIARLCTPGTDVYLPWIPGDAHEKIVSAAARLRAVGMNPVPHVPARHLKSVAQLRDYLAQARELATVEQVLVIGGDADRSAGPYATSQQILESGLLVQNGIKRVGFAGHPEGHPQVGADALLEALHVKASSARAQGLEPYVVTQFCFEAAPILNWLRTLRRIDPPLAVRVGLAGPANLTTLLKFALRCGIGNSARALGQQGMKMARLLTETNPEVIMREIADASAQDAQLRINGIHFFPFGGLERLHKWLSETL